MWQNEHTWQGTKSRKALNVPQDVVKSLENEGLVDGSVFIRNKNTEKPAALGKNFQPKNPIVQSVTTSASTAAASGLDSVKKGPVTIDPELFSANVPALALTGVVEYKPAPAAGAANTSPTTRPVAPIVIPSVQPKPAAVAAQPAAAVAPKTPDVDVLKGQVTEATAAIKALAAKHARTPEPSSPDAQARLEARQTRESEALQQKFVELYVPFSAALSNPRTAAQANEIAQVVYTDAKRDAKALNAGAVATVEVEKGDTLVSIAQRQEALLDVARQLIGRRPGRESSAGLAVAIAIAEHNPRVVRGDIEDIQAGSTLRMPTEQQLRASVARQRQTVLADGVIRYREEVQYRTVAEILPPLPTPAAALPAAGPSASK